MYYNQNYKNMQNYAIYGSYNEMLNINTHKSVSLCCKEVYTRS